MKEKSNYNIVFLGTPDFASPSLQALLKLETLNLKLVITQPDKPVGRKKVLTASPIKTLALKNNLTVGHDLTEIKTIKPDLCIVVAYGKIIPQDILAVCPFLNLHPSLLPKYRGPSPIQYALKNGDSETGVTIMELDAGMDTGPILVQEKANIEAEDNYPTLSKKLAEQGANLLVKTLQENPEPKPQIIDKKTVTKLIKREDGEVNLKNDPPEEIINKLRAFTPWPGIFTYYNDKRLKILKAHLSNGQLILNQVQLEGKKPISYQEFINSY